MHRILYFFLLISFYFEAFSPVLGAEEIIIKRPPHTGPEFPPNTPGGVILSTLLTNAITIIFTISTLAILVMMLWGAFEWIVSGGNKDKLVAAQKRITNALIGAAILALSFVVLRVVGEVLQINILGPYPIPKLLG